MKLKIVTVWALVLTCFAALAQTPDLYPPTVPEPIELNLFNILLYIVSPVLLFVFLYFWRRKRKAQRRQAKEDQPSN